MVASGDVDFGASFGGSVVYQLDAGLPLTALAGLHAGCYELFAHEPIRNVSDLKGRRVGIQTLASSAHLYLSIMATYVGLDAQRNIEWVVPPDGKAMDLFVAGGTDAFLGFPPEPQELRARLRPGDPEVGQRPAVVAVLLLHDLWQPRLGGRASGRDQAFTARGVQGRRVL
jgi:NitT/TauT family transport system substrate-binding protein